MYVLTDREEEILSLLSKGLSRQEAAATLAIAPETVKAHARSIYRKLGVNRKFDAIVLAKEIGLLQ